MAGLYQSMTIKPTTTGHPPTCASLMTLSPLVDSNMIDIPQADSIPLQEPATAESCSSSADYIPDPSTYVHPMLTRSKAVNGDNGWIVPKHDNRTYNNWASTNRFIVIDTIRKVYARKRVGVGGDTVGGNKALSERAENDRQGVGATAGKSSTTSKPRRMR
ncbi:hypothetical protein GOBAR_AA35448 [Gossypium barbadense]|uniref:Uncharacterized protein n=1 Tax=Gossypium barbadense TaxID=3634 RepID=A0A2P5W2F2_GOSBA|nr:hypothetical protein GOBAR_AA35448 [Gossypium barbadense]